jgi:hypothetical protein
MAETLESEVAAIGVRLLDDAYLAWVAAEIESSKALHAWLVGRNRRDEPYYVYLAALDREQAAALDLQRLTTVTEPCRDALSEREERLGQAS